MFPGLKKITVEMVVPEPLEKEAIDSVRRIVDSGRTALSFRAEAESVDFPVGAEPSDRLVAASSRTIGTWTPVWALVGPDGRYRATRRSCDPGEGESTLGEDASLEILDLGDEKDVSRIGKLIEAESPAGTSWGFYDVHVVRRSPRGAQLLVGRPRGPEFYISLAERYPLKAFILFLRGGTDPARKREFTKLFARVIRGLGNTAEERKIARIMFEEYAKALLLMLEFDEGPETGIEDLIRSRFVILDQAERDHLTAAFAEKIPAKDVVRILDTARAGAGRKNRARFFDIRPRSSDPGGPLRVRKLVIYLYRRWGLLTKRETRILSNLHAYPPAVRDIALSSVWVAGPEGGSRRLSDSWSYPIFLNFCVKVSAHAGSFNSGSMDAETRDEFWALCRTMIRRYGLIKELGACLSRAYLSGRLAELFREELWRVLDAAAGTERQTLRAIFRTKPKVGRLPLFEDVPEEFQNIRALIMEEKLR